MIHKAQGQAFLLHKCTALQGIYKKIALKTLKKYDHFLFTIVDNGREPKIVYLQKQLPLLKKNITITESLRDVQSCL